MRNYPLTADEFDRVSAALAASGFFSNARLKADRSWASQIPLYIRELTLDNLEVLADGETELEKPMQRLVRELSDIVGAELPLSPAGLATGLALVQTFLPPCHERTPEQKVGLFTCAVANILSCGDLAEHLRLTPEEVRDMVHDGLVPEGGKCEILWPRWSKAVGAIGVGQREEIVGLIDTLGFNDFGHVLEVGRDNARRAEEKSLASTREV